MAGRKERLAGKAMEWEGKVTGDPIRENEGKALTNYGKLKGKLEETKASLTDRSRGRSRKPFGHE